MWERYKMARRSPTKYASRPPGPRDDTGFNPFQETQKIIGFAEQATRSGHAKFAVIVKDGILEWTGEHIGKSRPGFIVVINTAKFNIGLTSRQWRRLEDRISIEMARQRKAW